uniref:U3 small nucleolar RNA-associated protein 20 C-terminal domain-containing protein n=1 Tax=Ditylenchus dipsaci TaxID=166011 RepID=A0A915DY39_9BILA
MLIMLIDVCSEEQISSMSLLVFMKLATCLINVPDDVCCKFVSMALRKLVMAVNESALSEMFSVSKDWFDSDKETVRYLALKVFAEFSQYFRDTKLSSSKLIEISCSVMLSLSQSGLMETKPENIISASIEFITLLLEPSKLEVFRNVVCSGQYITKFGEVLVSCLNCSSSKDLQLCSLFLDKLLSSGDAALVDKFNEAFDGGFETICRILCIQLGVKRFDQRVSEQALKNLAVLMIGLKTNAFTQITYRLEKMCWKEVVRYHDQAFRRLDLDDMCRKFMPIIYREIKRKSVKNTEELYELAMEVAVLFKSKLVKSSILTGYHFVKKNRLRRRKSEGRMPKQWLCLIQLGKL